jgi:TRAP-type C4-dicarboxylate transport system permease small subunit
MWKPRVAVGLALSFLLMTLLGGAALASDNQAATGTVTGLPAILIILAILALLIIGIVAVVRFVARKAKGN